jgi:hypothetical protein
MYGAVVVVSQTTPKYDSIATFVPDPDREAVPSSKKRKEDEVMFRENLNSQLSLNLHRTAHFALTLRGTNRICRFGSLVALQVRAQGNYR